MVGLTIRLTPIMYDCSHASNINHLVYRTAKGVVRFLIERESYFYLFGGRQFSRYVLSVIT